MNCKVQKLNITPNEVRKKILQMARSGNSGHIGCAFSVVEIIHTLYDQFLRINPNNSKDLERDFFVMSKGHGVMALYVCLAEVGIIDKKLLDHYFQDGSPLHGLAEYGIPGIEASGGSLGHGICVAQGMAFGINKRKSDQKVFCLVGDGETNEGTFWETIQFIAHHKLNNLVIIIDDNKYQAMGKTKDIISVLNLAKELEGFGLNVLSCDGHSPNELKSVFNQAMNSSMPTVVIANTIKGKGISFMEGDNIWHYKKLDQETFDLAMKELNS